jgi:hypothetical protein
MQMLLLAVLSSSATRCSTFERIAFDISPGIVRSFVFPVPNTIVLLDFPIIDFQASFTSRRDGTDEVRFAFAKPTGPVGGAFFGGFPGVMRIFASKNASVCFFVIPPFEPCPQVYFSAEESFRFQSHANLTQTGPNPVCLLHFYPAPKTIVTSVTDFSATDSLTLRLGNQSAISAESLNISDKDNFFSLFVFKYDTNHSKSRFNISITIPPSVFFPIVHTKFTENSPPVPVVWRIPSRGYAREHERKHKAERTRLFYGQLALVIVALATTFYCSRTTEQRWENIENEAMMTLRARLRGSDELAIDVESDSGGLQGESQFTRCD